MPAVTYDIVVGSRPVQAQHGPLGSFFIALSGVVDVRFRHEPDDTDQTLHRQLPVDHEECSITYTGKEEFNGDQGFIHGGCFFRDQLRGDRNDELAKGQHQLIRPDHEPANLGR